jgi:hypothetical protein
MDGHGKARGTAKSFTNYEIEKLYNREFDSDRKAIPQKPESNKKRLLVVTYRIAMESRVNTHDRRAV